MRKYVETRQSCGHTALWSSKHSVPKVGEKVYCVNCEDTTFVESHPGTWTAVCGIKTCRFIITRERIDKTTAPINAHLENYPAHFVRLANYERTVSVVLRSGSADHQNGGHESGTSGLDATPNMSMLDLEQ